MDWPIWNGLRRNITVYASSPKVEIFSSSPGSSKNYMIWKESTSIGTWDLRRITSSDTFPGTLSPATATLEPPASFGFCTQPQYRLCFSFSTQRNTPGSNFKSKNKLGRHIMRPQ